jgi:hypothetical protein
MFFLAFFSPLLFFSLSPYPHNVQTFMKSKRLWLDQHSPTTKVTMANTNVNNQSLLLSLPKELVLQIIVDVAIVFNDDNLYPQSLIELSMCCHSLRYLIYHDPWRFHTLWPCAFQERFDTGAIYRRQLDGWDWQKVMKLRCKALYACKAFAAQPNNIDLLDNICWEIIWDMITEHGNDKEQSTGPLCTHSFYSHNL